jgi:hypothetical protein
MVCYEITGRTKGYRKWFGNIGMVLIQNGTKRTYIIAVSRLDSILGI